MNKSKRQIQSNYRRYVATLCKTILQQKGKTRHDDPGYKESEEARIRNDLYDKLRNAWYTKFAQTPLQMAHELPKKKSLTRLAIFLRNKESIVYFRQPSHRNYQRPWGTYFSVKFPMVLFNCGQDIFIEQRLHELETHYVLWQDDQYKFITTGIKESHLV